MKARIKSEVDGDERGTPQWLFDMLKEIFTFTLDVAATAKNTKCKRCFTKGDNALIRSWNGRCFMNPPFSKLSDFCKKATDEILYNERCHVIVGIVPNDPSTQWWENYIRNIDAIVIPVPFRVGFVPPPGGKPGSNPFPTAIVIWSSLTADREAWGYFRE